LSEELLRESARIQPSCLSTNIFSYYDLAVLIESDMAEVVVAQLGSTIVASGFARIEQSKPYHLSQRRSYLGFMYVEPEYRRQGLSRKINNLVEWSRAQRVSGCLR